MIPSTQVTPVQRHGSSCIVSCQMFVKSEFPLDSALVCNSDQKKLGWHFFSQHVKL